MHKKSILILAFMFLFLPAFSEPQDNGGHAGTPPGFYDDINPEDIEKEEAEPAGEAYQTFEDETPADEVIIPPSQKTKPTKNYPQIYNDLQVPTFSYLHDIDPDQYYDMKDTSWSVYPLLRLISPIYFKNITIEPGYYLLTPREHQGNGICCLNKMESSSILSQYTREVILRKCFMISIFRNLNLQAHRKFIWDFWTL